MQRRHNSSLLSSLLQSDLAREAVTITRGESVRWRSRIYNHNLVRPNKSLKLTEIAVDDFARAQLGATIGRDMPRAECLRRAAARRRSLAPVR